MVGVSLVDLEDKLLELFTETEKKRSEILNEGTGAEKVKK